LKLCACHGVPMYPNGANRWRCRVKVRARQRPADLAYYHRAGGGYVKRRLRMLGAQRDHIIDQLNELREGASD
jgi:hypothetical protein